MALTINNLKYKLGETKLKTDVVVIGGGPAGMKAALSASKTGAKVILVERNNTLGGILNQCIHNGFGLHYFGEELTGPEYAHKFKELVKKDKNIKVLLNTFVTNINGKTLEIISKNGKETISAKSVVLAMGARERTAGNIMLTGTRPAGIYTAGLAQRMVNIEGKLPGKKVVILGSGDIGLIMARRLTYQGAEVLCVLEINKTTSGLERNVAQCLNDYNIPLHTSTTIFEVVGKERVTGIYYGKVDDSFNKIESSKKFLECDCVILSVGLIPEIDLIKNEKINPKTNSLFVDDNFKTENGYFACGNFLHIHDLVDNVTLEASDAGHFAALYALGQKEENNKYANVNICQNISYVLPSKILIEKGKTTLKFRVKNKLTKKKFIIKCGDEIIAQKFVLGVNPGEMQTLTFNKDKITQDITLEVE